MRNLPQLNEGDTVQLKKDRRVGLVLANDIPDVRPGEYKIDFGTGLYEWHHREALKILNRIKKGGCE
jgi:hypothetical protein